MYRTLLLYRALQPSYDVEIVGFDKGRGLWGPVRSERLSLRSEPLSGWGSLARSSYRLLAPLEADLVIASKARLPSFGLALVNRLFRGTPVILDVDDDERAMTRPPETVKARTILAYNLRNPDAYFSALAMHRMARSADHVFCVSEFFRSLYGGSIVPHGLKPHEYYVASESVDSLRSELGIHEAFVVVFVGTPRPHKGIAETLEAARRSGIDGIRVVVVGTAKGDSYVENLAAEYPDILVPVSSQPSERIPYYLALGDVTVIAQKDSPESHGQMPAKLTDAMLAGLPIIATSISDIPKYLTGCGILIERADPDLIAQGLRWVFEHPEEAKSFGLAARNVALEKLTDKAISKTMQAAISAVMQKRRPSRRPAEKA